MKNDRPLKLHFGRSQIITIEVLDECVDNMNFVIWLVGDN